MNRLPTWTTAVPHARGVAALLFRTTLLLLLAFGGADAAEDETAPSNIYMTGTEVRIDRSVEGDLVAAAGRIHIDQPILGDALLGAGSIDVQSSVGEDLRGAGGIVTLAGKVGHEVLIAAGRIITTSDAVVNGETWLAAASVTLDGRFVSAVRVYARDITLSGETFGPVELSGKHIEIAEGARVHGDLTYTSSHDIKIHPRARIEGTVTHKPAHLEANPPTRTLPGLKPLRPLALAAMLALGALVLAIFPRLTASSVRTLAAAPGKSVGLGSALFFGIPPVALLLIITIIGIPIALALILAQAFALACGYIVSTMLIAHGLARTLGRHALTGWRQYAFMAAAILVLALLTSIPYVGVVLVVLACSAGLGAMVLQRFSRRAGRDASESDEWPAS